MTRVLTAFLALIATAAAGAQPASTLFPRVHLETTHGTIIVELDTVRAPLTAENFLRYVRDGFYDGTLFHRVIPNFVVQGGGHGRDFAEKPTRAAIPNESGNGLSNRRGTLAMARVDTPHSATAQFYINLYDNQRLDPLPTRWGYAVFGRVVGGMEVVDRIAHLPTGAAGPFPADVPQETAMVIRAWVIGDPGTPAEVTPPPPEPAAEPAASA